MAKSQLQWWYHGQLKEPTHSSLYNSNLRHKKKLISLLNFFSSSWSIDKFSIEWEWREKPQIRYFIAWCSPSRLWFLSIKIKSKTTPLLNTFNTITYTSRADISEVSKKENHRRVLMDDKKASDIKILIKKTSLLLHSKVSWKNRGKLN